MTRANPDAPTVLAIDQGTTTSKALLVDAAGRVLARGQASVPIRFPRPGWVEQDAEHLWDSVLTAVERCLAAAPTVRPTALAVSNQRESVVAWDRRDGRPVGPVLGWQDARTVDRCAALAARGVDVVVAERTGLTLDPMFSAPKMAWLAEHAVEHGTPDGALALGTVDSWLVHRLTGGAVHAAEAGNASRTLLFDLEQLDWHADLLDAFGVQARWLGTVQPSDQPSGTTVAAGVLPAGLPVLAVMADSHAALHTHAAAGPGAAKATYGTGSSVMARVTDLKPGPAGISTTLAWLGRGGPVYAREGNVLATGAALDWTASLLGCPDGEPGGAFLGRLAAGADDAGGVVLVPAFTGLGAPYWDRRATAVLAGLRPGTGPAHLARAAFDAVAHQVTDVVEAMVSDGHTEVEVLGADGGATASAVLMQTQADLLGRPVRVSEVADASPRGAALMALAALGVEPAAASRSTTDDVVPRLPGPARVSRRDAWHEAVRRARLSPDGSD